MYNFRKYFKSRYGNDLVKNYYGDSSPLVLLKLFNLPYSHLHIVDVLPNVQLGPRPSQKNTTLVLDQRRNFNPGILEMARVGLG